MEDFAISVYDLFTNGSLLDDLIDQKLVLPLFWSLLGISFLVVIIYYYVINSPRFSKLSQWIITLAISSLIVGIIHFSTCASMANQQIPRDPNAPAETVTYFFDQGTAVFFTFALQVFFIAISLFLLFSSAFKWWSTNARKTPF